MMTLKAVQRSMSFEDAAERAGRPILQGGVERPHQYLPLCCCQVIEQLFQLAWGHNALLIAMQDEGAFRLAVAALAALFYHVVHGARFAQGFARCLIVGWNNKDLHVQWGVRELLLKQRFLLRILRDDLHAQEETVEGGSVVNEV